MSENLVPPEQSVSPTDGNQQQTTDWQAAYKALQGKYNAQNSLLQAAQQAGTSKDTEIETLRTTLGAEKMTLEQKYTAEQAGRNALAAQLAEAQTQNKTLLAEKTKFDALATLEATPEVKAGLLKVMSKLPSADTLDLQKEILQTFAGAMSDVANARETQLKAGVTPGYGIGAAAPADPSSVDGWNALVGKTSWGTPEYEAVQERYLAWAMKNQ